MSETKEQSFAAVAKTFTVEKKPGSEVEISGEIPYEALESFEKAALKNIAGELELPGFRRGHVPEDLALKQVGELEVLQEAANMYLRELYPAILEAHEIDAVGRPEIHITKLASKNPVGLHIHTSVYPVIALPKNWKDVAAKVPAEPTVDVTDKDVEEALTSIRRAHAKANAQVPVAPDAELKDEELPPLDDAFAKSLGDFLGVTDLTEKLRANMVLEKGQQARDKRRGKIIDALLEKTEVEVPKIFVDSELEKIIGQMKDDVARFGLTFEGYLSQVGKTEEALKEEFTEQAKKRAKLQMVLNKIAADEKIDAEKADVDEEMKHALEHFPEAKQDLLRIHIETVLRNEQVLKMLEQLETK
jgi:FKBP-type peptidyl-prolyl cis-trans isomerase (trigger factor)